MATHNTTKTDVLNEVRNVYGAIAKEGRSCCGPTCCAPGAQPGDAAAPSPRDTALRLGYTAEEVDVAADGNLGLGCGNPQAIAELQRGERVLDLGSGAGFDCFLAARRVGPGGRVVGVDMTPEMLERARANAQKLGVTNVEFRLGEIEHLPVADQTVDVVISNCVINLSPDKPAVFREALRVLRPGGRVAISDVVALGEMPKELAEDLALYTGCVAGAARIEDVKRLLSDAGFVDVRVEVNESLSGAVAAGWAPGRGVERFVASARIEARRPSSAGAEA